MHNQPPPRPPLIPHNRRNRAAALTGDVDRPGQAFVPPLLSRAQLHPSSINPHLPTLAIIGDDDPHRRAHRTGEVSADAGSSGLTADTNPPTPPSPRPPAPRPRTHPPTPAGHHTRNRAARRVTAPPQPPRRARPIRDGHHRTPIEPAPPLDGLRPAQPGTCARANPCRPPADPDREPHHSQPIRRRGAPAHTGGHHHHNPKIPVAGMRHRHDKIPFPEGHGGPHTPRATAPGRGPHHGTRRPTARRPADPHDEIRRRRQMVQRKGKTFAPANSPESSPPTIKRSF